MDSGRAERRTKMRGINDTGQAQSPVLGQAFYNFCETHSKDSKAALARARFKTPPYCYGERRKEWENGKAQEVGEDIDSQGISAESE